MSSQKSAQLRAEQIQAFDNELSLLTQENVLTLSKEQSEKLDSYHQGVLSEFSQKFDIDETSSQKKLSLGMKISSFLAALALSFSVLFLFLQFWGNFSQISQIFVLVLAPSLLLALTYYLSKKHTNDYYTKITALLTLVCFVLNLSMLGQIFNISPSPNAFFIWAAFSGLLAYALNARLLLGVSIISFSFFLSAKVGVMGGGYWLNLSDYPENFLVVAFILFGISFVKHSKEQSFDVVYRYFGMFLFFFPVLILSNYGSISYMQMPKDFIEGFYQVVGFGMSALAIYVGIKKGYSELVNTGNVFFVIFLYTKLFQWWWDYMPKYIFFLVIGLSAFLVLTILRRLRK